MALLKFLLLILCVSIAIFLCSCSSSKKINKEDYTYFKDGGDTVLMQVRETIIQPNDVLSIQVYSRTSNQDQATIFNIPNNANTPVQGYQVNLSGKIEMPIIGSINAAGLTLDQLQNTLIEKLSNFVKNPSVIVRFLAFNVIVLGEVHNPGIHKFSIDRVTIIDAIGAAGDLTDYGKRNDVTVIREENGKKIYQTIDLRNRNIFQSPVYLLEPNDIVYVKPNANKLKDISVDQAAQRKTGIALAIVSILVSIATLIVFTLKLD